MTPSLSAMRCCDQESLRHRKDALMHGYKMETHSAEKRTSSSSVVQVEEGKKNCTRGIAIAKPKATQ